MSLIICRAFLLLIIKKVDKNSVNVNRSGMMNLSFFGKKSCASEKNYLRFKVKSRSDYNLKCNLRLVNYILIRNTGFISADIERKNQEKCGCQLRIWISHQPVRRRWRLCELTILSPRKSKKFFHAGFRISRDFFWYTGKSWYDIWWWSLQGNSL